MNFFERKIYSIKHFSLGKTIRFNFHYFPFEDAIKLPVLISRSTKFISLKGSIKIMGPIRFGMIRFGAGYVTIFDIKNAYSALEINGEIIFNGNCRFGSGIKISLHEKAKLIFGMNFMISAETAIVCRRLISFGNDVLIPWECLIMDTDFHDIFCQDNKINHDRAICIGNKVWIGMKTTILKGVEIPDNTVIAACSLLKGGLPQTNNTIIGTTQNLRVIRENVSW